MQHTELPWGITEDRRNGKRNRYEYPKTKVYSAHWELSPPFIADCRPSKRRIPQKESEANAAFIVTACNNHYQLLEALEMCIKAMPVGKFAPCDEAIGFAKEVINNAKTNK